MARFTLVALALLSLTALGSAARPIEQKEDFISSVESQLTKFFKDLTAKTRATVHDSVYSALKREQEDQPFTLLVKYAVRPSDHEDFVEKWMDTREETKQEKHNLKYTLSKPMTENIVFYTYGEWESAQDFYDHFTSSYIKDFIEYLADKDIPFFLTSLIKIEDEDWYKRGNALAGGVSDASQFGASDLLKEGEMQLQDVLKTPLNFDEPKKLYLLIKYVVRPSESKDFVKEWLKTRDATEQEKGNNVYTLSKTKTDNVIFYSYAEWERPEDFYAHVKSKHVKKFAEYLKEEDVPISLSLLLPVEKIAKKD